MNRKIFMMIPPPGSRIPKYVSAVDSSGKSIYSDFNAQEIGSDAYLDIPLGVDCLDRLLTSGNEIILSAKCLSITKNCKIDPNIVRRSIIAHPSFREKHLISGYELWFSRIQHDILHKDAVTKEVKGHILSIYEWVVAIEKIPDLDIFLGNTNKWFVSERFVHDVFESRLSGFGFALIPCF